MNLRSKTQRHLWHISILTTLVFFFAVILFPIPSLAVGPRPIVPHPSQRTSGSPRWHVVSSPNIAATNAYFSGVTESATPRLSIWAVGHYHDPRLGDRTLIEQMLDGRWYIQSSPNTGTSDALLAAAEDPDSYGMTWAVGYFINSTGHSQTLIEAYSQASGWFIVASPNTGSADRLLGVTEKVSDAWAVGNSSNPATHQEQTLIERANGQIWSIVKSPNVSGAPINSLSSVAEVSSYENGQLDSVVVISAQDIWAVGSYYNMHDSVYATLIEVYF